MKRRVRAEVRASPTLRRECKQARKARRRQTIIRPWAYRFFILPALLPLFMQASRPVALIIAFVWLWSLTLAFLRANQLTAALYFSPVLNVFNHLPVSDGQIFQVQWKSWIRNSIWSSLDFFAAYSALAYHVGSRLDCLIAGALLGILQWVFVLATATCLFAWWPRRLLYLPMLLFGGFAVGLLIFGWRQLALVNWLSGFAFWIPPVGWILYAMGIAGDTGLAHDALPSVMAGAVLVVFPAAYRRIRHAYVLDEKQFAAARKATATGEAAASPWQEHVDRFIQAPTDVESYVRNRRFLEHLNWRDTGWVERLVASMLTIRERTVAEFLVAANPRWTRRFRNFLISAAILFVLVRFVIAHLGFDLTFLAFCGVYLLITGNSANWRGFATVSAAGQQPPLYSFHPIGFWELFRSVLKVNTMRYALSLPVAALVILLAINSLKLSLAAAALYGWRIVVVGFLAQVILAIAPVSAASNDTGRFGFAAAVVTFILVLLGMGGAFVLLTSPALVLASLAALCAWLALGVMFYARRFNRGRFDLVPATKTASGLSH